MTQVTTEYRDLQFRMHQEKPGYGTFGHMWAPVIMQLAANLDTHDILDYGCGKASLNLHLPFGIQCYDPCIPKYSARPRPAKIVVCTDVMEHVEEDCVDAVLDDLQSLTLDMLVLNIALKESLKHLPDGRNAHITLKPVPWWMEKIEERFVVLNKNDEEETLSLILRVKR